MKINKIHAGLAGILLCASCAVQKSEPTVQQDEITRIINTLASDDMQGRGTFTPGIDKAASFIEAEFKKIGLQPLAGENDFRQEFTVTRISPALVSVTVDGKSIEAANIITMSEKALLEMSNTSGAGVVKIAAGDQFAQKYTAALSGKTPTLVLVDQSHSAIFKRVQARAVRGRIVEKMGDSGGTVFVLGTTEAGTFNVKANSKVESLSLFNVAGMIPGKSKEKELVLFSAHYDHLGTVASVEGDSIANGADDDASGTTAVISLAKYYKQLKNNERTLIFVAFTAEEIGGFGARHFSSKLNPDDVVAMFNIEMIGKESKFGKNAAFITGYERSDFGEILQKNLAGTDFKFHPDPYPTQNLFYRSDNATLAALGVPAHTISTDQIDSDKFYHTVNDEVETLDSANIWATIKAIALSARSIVAGTDTPKRIPKLEARQ
ncbi:M20/M25/M40 family metallo-hydrolase [Daejeonella lutea]|uniref:Peptidase family M28 n=1 Tax=Daejeonella lutea TaxID=572036 RepID=A0A1T5DSD8_9SPHI|nr:M20/M25/M40 family metallo-hydrolase [Daejeonella lutea]SKB74343.1 Peptidase family M28 [Daejeonella lutea]